MKTILFVLATALFTVISLSGGVTATNDAINGITALDKLKEYIIKSGDKYILNKKDFIAKFDGHDNKPSPLKTSLKLTLDGLKGEVVIHLLDIEEHGKEGHGEIDLEEIAHNWVILELFDDGALVEKDGKYVIHEKAFEEKWAGISKAFELTEHNPAVAFAALDNGSGHGHGKGDGEVTLSELKQHLKQFFPHNYKAKVEAKIKEIQKHVNSKHGHKGH